jgi:hypothetical protein
LAWLTIKIKPILFFVSAIIWGYVYTTALTFVLI